MPVLYHNKTSLKGICEILRIKEEKGVADFFEKMAAMTGKPDILQKILYENEALVERSLRELGLPETEMTHKGFADRAYEALIKKVETSDRKLFAYLKNPNLLYPESVATMLFEASRLSGVKSGFFLKESKAREMLLKNPPPNILQFLGYKNSSELLEHENIWEVYPALRMLETPEWMNNVFLKEYADLTPNDFEERDIKLFVMSRRWLDIAERFMKKKHHNVSHLKELGIIFVIPITLDNAGEMLRLFGLLLHYLHEVPFYSNLFKRYARESKNFAADVQSLLRGDVLEGPLPDPGEGKMNIRIVQRYLAKDDPNDHRLFEPHVNPETRHWDWAEADLTKLSGEVPDLDLGFWSGQNWVGDCFMNAKGEDAVINFNLIDTTMSLVKRQEAYLYHHEEAVWNKIFMEYLGEAEVDKLIEDHLIQGYFTLG